MAKSIILKLDGDIKFECASAHGSQAYKAMVGCYDMGMWSQAHAHYASDVFEARRYIDANGGVGVIARNDAVIEHTIPIKTAAVDDRQLELA